MKKLTLIVVSLLVAAMLCACGGNGEGTTNTTGSNSTQDTAPNNAPSTTPVGYLCSHNGVQMGVNSAAEDILSKLGEPSEKDTTASCAFGGEDTIYTYQDFEVSTNNELGYEQIYSIYLSSDNAYTEEGICIGATVDEVKTVYGDPAEEIETCLTYRKDGMTLSFNINNGVVSSIRYNYN